MGEFQWSAAEKQIARGAFNAALATRSPGSWRHSRRRPLRPRRLPTCGRSKTICVSVAERSTTFSITRYSRLLFVFARLIRDGHLDEAQLAGLAEDKLAAIRRLRPLFGKLVGRRRTLNPGRVLLPLRGNSGKAQMRGQFRSTSRPRHRERHRSDPAVGVGLPTKAVARAVRLPPIAAKRLGWIASRIESGGRDDGVRPAGFDDCVSCWCGEGARRDAASADLLPPRIDDLLCGSRNGLRSAMGRRRHDESARRRLFDLARRLRRGPEQSLENPLGKRGRELTTWFFGTRIFQAMIGKDGGADGVDEDYAHRAMDGFGAFILGRNMFGPSRGPWPDEAGRAGGATIRPITRRPSC